MAANPQLGDSAPGTSSPPRTMQAVNLAVTDYVPQIQWTDELSGNLNTMNVRTRWVYIGVTGDLSVEPVFNPAGAGTPVLLKAMPAGLYQMQVVKIYKTNTTATFIVAMW